MELKSAIALIQNNFLASQTTPQVWADLGCGDGLFSRALASLLPSGSTIYAIDKKPSRIISPTASATIKTLTLDFVKDPIPVPPLDGLLMANAFHYVADKVLFVTNIRGLLKPDSVWLLVEYDTDLPVPTWVPFPMSYTSLSQFFRSQGFGSIEKLGEQPSVYGRANIYSALVAP